MSQMCCKALLHGFVYEVLGKSLRRVKQQIQDLSLDSCDDSSLRVDILYINA